MFRKTLLAALALTPLLAAQDRGAKVGLIDVQNYAIDAEVNPRTQSLTAVVKVRFVPLASDISSLSFELNNALNLSRVIDETGRQIQTSRSTQDYRGAAQPSGTARERHAHHLHVQLRRTLDRPGRFAGLRHQIRLHSERIRVPDVSGALVSYQRLYGGSLHRRPAHHRAFRL